jgi:hypothetical protein
MYHGTRFDRPERGMVGEAFICISIAASKKIFFISGRLFIGHYEKVPESLQILTAFSSYDWQIYCMKNYMNLYRSWQHSHPTIGSFYCKKNYLNLYRSWKHSHPRTIWQLLLYEKVSESLQILEAFPSYD